MFYVSPFATGEQKRQKSLAVKKCCYETLTKSNLVSTPWGKPAERYRVSSGTVPDRGGTNNDPTLPRFPRPRCTSGFHLQSLESTEATVRLLCVYGLGLALIL